MDPDLRLDLAEMGMIYWSQNCSSILEKVPCLNAEVREGTALKASLFFLIL